MLSLLLSYVLENLFDLLSVLLDRLAFRLDFLAGLLDGVACAGHGLVRCVFLTLDAVFGVLCDGSDVLLDGLSRLASRVNPVSRSRLPCLWASDASEEQAQASGVQHRYQNSWLTTKRHRKLLSFSGDGLQQHAGRFQVYKAFRVRTRVKKRKGVRACRQ